MQGAGDNRTLRGSDAYEVPRRVGSVETEAGWAVRGLGPGRGVGFVGTEPRLGKVAEFGERQAVVTCASRANEPNIPALTKKW